MAKERMMNQGTRTPTIKELTKSSREGSKHPIGVSPRKDKPLGLDKTFGNAIPHEQRLDPYKVNSNASGGDCPYSGGSGPERP